MTALTTLLSLALVAGEVSSATPASGQGTLTVPLPEALELLGRSMTPKPEQVVPPMSAGVVSQRLVGRVGLDVLEVRARITVTVLDGTRWSRLALFRLEPGVTLVDASKVEGGMVTVHEGQVVLVARSVGTSTLELVLAVRASGARTKVARLCRGAEALDGVLTVEADGALEVPKSGTEVASEGGCWAVAWRGEARARVETPVARAPLEPTVHAASGRLVSTMEGRARLSVLYQLVLDRDQPLAIEVPEGWAVKRLVVNEVPSAVASNQRSMALTVSPVRPGERRGTVALVLERDYGVFHLSGRLGVELPSVSWPTRLVELDVHLPTVFDYRRAGGSLEPMAEGSNQAPEVEAFAASVEAVEAPGKKLSFRQHLVSSAGPTLELKYSVDLERRYFSSKGER